MVSKVTKALKVKDWFSDLKIDKQLINKLKRQYSPSAPEICLVCILAGEPSHTMVVRGQCVEMLCWALHVGLRFFPRDTTADCSNSRRPGWPRLWRREESNSKKGVNISGLLACEERRRYNAPGESPPPDYSNNITSWAIFPFAATLSRGVPQRGCWQIHAIIEPASASFKKGTLLLDVFHFGVTHRRVLMSSSSKTPPSPRFTACCDVISAQTRQNSNTQ